MTFAPSRVKIGCLRTRHGHEQIAVRAAVGAGVALVAHAEGLSVVDARRDLDPDGLACGAPCPCRVQAVQGSVMMVPVPPHFGHG